MSLRIPSPAPLAAILAPLLLTGLLAEEPPTPSEPVPAEVFKAATAPKIDGTLDDECWKKATVFDVHYIMAKKGVKAESSPMKVQYTWDDHFFYIGYETFDTNVRSLGKEHQEGPPDNRREVADIWNSDPEPWVDVVEFFITFGDENFFWELHHNALNQLGDVLIMSKLPYWQGNRTNDRPAIAMWNIYFGHGEYVQDEGPYELPDGTIKRYKLATATKLKPKADGTPSTPNKVGDKDTGYTAELRLPWYGIGARISDRTWIKHPPKEGEKRPIMEGGPWKMTGKVVSVIAVCQNPDLKDRYHHSGEKFYGGWFHHGVKEYPRLKLVNPAAETK